MWWRIWSTWWYLIVILKYLILYQIFKTILNTSSKSMKHWLVNYWFRYTLTKFKTESHSKSKLGTILNIWHLRLWKYWKKDNHNKNDENVSHLEIIGVILIDLIFSIISIGLIQEPCAHLFQIDRLVSC